MTTYNTAAYYQLRQPIIQPCISSNPISNLIYPLCISDYPAMISTKAAFHQLPKYELQLLQPNFHLDLSFAQIALPDYPRWIVERVHFS